jgi:hypothetical protein
VVGVPFSWVVVIRGVAVEVAAEVVVEVIVEVIAEVVTEVVVVRGAAGVVGAAGAVGVARAAIGVAGSAAIGTTSGWVDRRYSKGPTGALLDSGRLCVLGGLVTVG